MGGLAIGQMVVAKAVFTLAKFITQIKAKTLMAATT
jgi:hypothetical protein